MSPQETGGFFIFLNLVTTIKIYYPQTS